MLPAWSSRVLNNVKNSWFFHPNPHPHEKIAESTLTIGAIVAAAMAVESYFIPPTSLSAFVIEVIGDTGSAMLASLVGRLAHKIISNKSPTMRAGSAIVATTIYFLVDNNHLQVIPVTALSPIIAYCTETGASLSVSAAAGASTIFFLNKLVRPLLNSVELDTTFSNPGGIYLPLLTFLPLMISRHEQKSTT